MMKNTFTSKKFLGLAIATLFFGSALLAQPCTPAYTTGTSDGDQIEGVELESISNTGSGGEITGIGYSDYTDLSTDLAAGGTYTITVTNGGSWSITVSAWIDYNMNDVFETDEVIGNFSFAAGASGSADFSVPVTAMSGETTMRVRGIYPSGGATPLDPCSSATYGEAEDYTINLTGGIENNIAVVGMPSPTSGADIGYEDVTVSLWNTGTSDASGFTVSYNVDGGLITSDFYPGTLAAGETADYTFGEGWTFTDYGCSEVVAWIEWDADEFDGDDSYTKNVCNAGPVTGTGAWYINSNVPGFEPWSSTSNIDAMDAVFGASWTAGKFEEVDPFEIFGSDNCFVFLEGSDQHAVELEAFLDANITTIESWVASGGRLLLNAAPNEGDGMSFGFDGTSLIYTYFTSNAEAADPGHPIFMGPFTPVGTNWTGGSFGHARIEGTDINTLIWDELATSNVVLGEKYYGSGIVLFGGMTTNNFHAPLTEAANLRANIISYLSCETVTTCTAPGGVSVEVVSSTVADVSWDAVDGATMYVFVLRDNTTGEHWRRNTEDTFMNLPALTPGHSYTTRIKTNCYPDAMSAPSESVDFSTPLRAGMMADGVNIYPNPSNGQFRIQLNGFSGSNMTLQVVNMMGQVVYSSILDVIDDVSVEDVNLSNLSAGTYMVRIVNGESSMIQTIVIE